MKIKEVIREDQKFEVYKNNQGSYDVWYYEYYSNCGWRYIGEDKNFSAEALEDFYGIAV